MNIKLCSYIGKFCYIYDFGIKVNKTPPRLFHIPHLLCFTEFSNHMFIKNPLPSVYLGPKTK